MAKFEDGKIRCDWVSNDPLYIQYHDQEWGKLVKDDRKLFEFLILESAQAGLSWITILKRREGYRKAFADFDPVKVARFSEKKVQKLLQDTGIIRNQLKIRAAINNAQCFLKIQKEFGSFYNYSMQFTQGRVKKNRWKKMKDVPAKTTESEALSRDLKRRGFKFFGPTIAYAHMQAVGQVNDHTTDCFCYR